MNIGFVSTRFAGVDGVSLEANKWAEVLERSGHTCFWLAGELDKDSNDSMLVPLAHFAHETIQNINEECFRAEKRSANIEQEIKLAVKSIKTSLQTFVERFSIDVLIPQNSLTIPMNLPLGLALTEFIEEHQFPTLAHHHDFYWERERFTQNCCDDLLQRAFPPRCPSIRHVVINQAAQRDLKNKKHLDSTVVPNVMDFTLEPPTKDDVCESLREQLHIPRKNLLMVQPTRVVPRKGIELAIDLAAKLSHRSPTLIVTHPSGDEGAAYKEQLIQHAERLAVDLRFLDDRIQKRRVNQEEQIFSLDDAYQNADLVTFPSLYEGFGNALLEAVYFRKPVFINRYAVYEEDIAPAGCDFFAIDHRVTDEQARTIDEILRDEAKVKSIVDRNFQICHEWFGYEKLTEKLAALLGRFI